MFIVFILSRRVTTFWAAALLLCVISSTAAAQVQRPLCRDGNNEFQADYKLSVFVTVQPGKNGDMALRVCDASLNWETQKLTVAEHAAQIDLDLFGVDLESGLPVAGFQVKHTNADCCVSYQLYSLASPPHLIKTIKRGSFFTAADRDLDGRIEFWTDDAAAVDGLDGVYATEIDYLPTYVLRFDHGRILDSSAAFQGYFDEIVKSVRAKNRSGRPSRFPAQRW